MINQAYIISKEHLTNEGPKKMAKVEGWQLKQRQALPLDMKEAFTEKRIRSWYSHWDGQVYVSFSGGKDSTVLLDMVRRIYPEVPAVFVDTGLEFPEIREFVKSVENVTWLKPKMSFNKVVEKYGYPVVSKENAQKIEEIRNTKSDKLRNKRLHGDEKGNGKLSEKWKYLIESDYKISAKCCNVMKKSPVKKYEKETGRKPFVGTMAADSTGRATSYLRNGCNSFESTRPMSTPMAFWLEDDIWAYLEKDELQYSSIYDLGYTRTGCMFCMFGVHLEKGENRFQRMKRTHPNQYEYCLNQLGCAAILDDIDVEY